MSFIFRLAGLLFVLALPVLFISVSLCGAVNSLSLYRYGFDRYQKTSLDSAQLEGVARELVNYFNSDDQAIQIVVELEGEEVALFSEREIVHLKDVKGLIQLDYKVLWGSLGYIVAFTVGLALWRKRSFRRDLSLVALWGGVFTVALMLALGIAMLVGFERVFLGFHLVSFANDYWMLPSDAYLLNLFPEGFFRDAALFVAGMVLVEALVVGGVGLVMLTRVRR